MQNTTTKKSKNIMNMFSGKQILIPIAALLLLAVFNLRSEERFSRNAETDLGYRSRMPSSA